MRINSKEKLFGQPVLKIREVVRYAMTERLRSIQKSMLFEEVSRILGQSTGNAKTVIEQLIKEEYLVLNKVKYVNTFQYELSETKKGRRFGVATADPLITREKANQLLKELIERAISINANEEYACYVERLSVFGSYLSDKTLLGDLDIFFKITRKSTGEEYKEQRQQRIELAFKSGRVFQNYIEQIHWPQREVLLALKTRKKGLSLHDETVDEVYKKTQSKVVYEFERKKMKDRNGKIQSKDRNGNDLKINNYQ
jgi:23S rRNA maturation mini-RNase III